MINKEETNHSWLDFPLSSWIKLNWETIIFISLILLGIFSRFYDLETRVMSHDETSHVYFSWRLEQGMGYQHDPVTHGPLQFHLVALSYFLFGDNDFTARIPAAIFSIATIAFMWFYRRYLGRAGALVAGLFFLISPYFLFYGRYVRNEAFVGLFGVMTLWAILRYLNTGQPRFMLFLTIVNSLHFTAKETSFIYTAQALIFLGVFLIVQLYRKSWNDSQFKQLFFITLIIAILLIAGGGTGLMITGKSVAETEVETLTPSIPGQDLPSSGLSGNSILFIVLISLGVVSGLVSIFLLVRGYSWEKLKNERSFDLIVILFTMVMPMLAPFPVRLLGYNPIAYQNSQTILFDAIFGVLFILLAVGIGLLWNPKLFLQNVAAFYAIFIVFYTTFFTNGFGAVTGLYGSLGYWLEQQGVNRGSQPWYFYLGVQVPIYEYLPLIGAIAAFFIGLSKFWMSVDQPSKPDPNDDSDNPLLDPSKDVTFLLLVYWCITSMIAFTVAGEKMPWITLHIALPLILLAAWGIGKIIDNINWRAFFAQRGVLVVLIIPVLFASGLGVLSSLLGGNPPFQGKELDQLQATSTFLAALIFLVLSGVAITKLIKEWQPLQFKNVIGLSIFVFLTLLTARTGIMAAFINYDDATEFLVYAHSAKGPKQALAQIEEISRRTTDGLAIQVAYDNETTYPYWWYFRDYTQQNYYGENPTRELRNAPIILVGDNNYGKIEPIVGQGFYQFDYIRLWWPNQDYFGLNWEKIKNALLDPQMRVALFKIWLNRDYTLYGQLTDKDLSLPNWYPSARMRLYIRKDIVAQLWNYGTSVAPEVAIADPYEGKQVTLEADQVIGSFGAEAGQFQRPRDLAIAPDGSLYVADTENHRIQHLDTQGNVLNMWGNFADVSADEAPGGTFNQPWGIAVAPDGSVFVADTWNHRVQKFTANGEFISMWGYLGQGDDFSAFWGPRDIAVSQDGLVYVTDTGNKRIVVFDLDGTPITQFGEGGVLTGQLDEPVGVAVDIEGRVYVADTWNQRVQIFAPDVSGTYIPIDSWDVACWYGQSLDNKPYLATDANGHIFIVDPEGYRVLVFFNDGQFIEYWGDYSTGNDGFGLPASIAVTDEGSVWVSDAGNSRIMHFNVLLPVITESESP